MDSPTLKSKELDNYITISRNMMEKKRTPQCRYGLCINKHLTEWLILADWLTYLATAGCWLTNAACPACKYLDILTIDNMAVLWVRPLQQTVNRDNPQTELLATGTVCLQHTGTQKSQSNYASQKQAFNSTVCCKSITYKTNSITCHHFCDGTQTMKSRIHRRTVWNSQQTSYRIQISLNHTIICIKAGIKPSIKIWLQWLFILSKTSVTVIVTVVKHKFFPQLIIVFNQLKKQ